MAYAQVTVTTTPTQLVAAVNGASLIYVRGATSVFIGTDASVTSATGFQLDTGQSIGIDHDFPSSQALWAVAASGSSRVDVLTGGV